MPLPASMTPGKRPGGSPQSNRQPSARRRPDIQMFDIGVPYQKCRIKICELAYIPDLPLLYYETAVVSKQINGHR